MPNIKSQIKRDQTNKAANLANNSIKSELRTAIKKVEALVKEGKKEEAENAKAQVAALKADGKALEEIMEKAQKDMTNELLEIPN
ncbi:MAG TPA: serine--tRNA ligase, partial [Firmicutes bacterium]|nr:serine--tRNA ligase [Bacillota bacterium]